MPVSTIKKLLRPLLLTSSAVWMEAQGSSRHKRAAPPGSPQKAVQAKKRKSAVFVCICQMLNLRSNFNQAIFLRRFPLVFNRHQFSLKVSYSVLLCFRISPYHIPSLVVNPNPNPNPGDEDSGDVGPLLPVQVGRKQAVHRGNTFNLRVNCCD